MKKTTRRTTIGLATLKELELQTGLKLAESLGGRGGLRLFYSLITHAPLKWDVDFDPVCRSIVRGLTMEQSIADIRDEYQCSRLLSKSHCWGGSDEERKDVAMTKFRQAEDLCQEQNAFLSYHLDLGPSGLIQHLVTPYWDIRSNGFHKPWMHVCGTRHCTYKGRRGYGVSRIDLDLLDRMKSVIRRILGPVEASLPYIEQHMDYGPGSTLTLKRDITRGRKFATRELTLAPSLVTFASSLLSSIHDVMPDRPTLRVVSWSKVTTVPKDSTTHRTIAIEADLNIYVQKGIGAGIRRRLKLFGLDLNDSSENSVLACKGSMDPNSYATFDLSMASDTISFDLVRAVLPPDWVSLLNVARSAHYKLDDCEIIPFHKWSSMGNGYTFELESLIFYAMLYALCERHGTLLEGCRTFGDDLIFPTSLASSVTRALTFLGFKVNSTKSYAVGYFRESCGTDYLCGVDIRPVFLKGKPNDASLHEVTYQYANALRLRAHANKRESGCDGRYLPVWVRLFTSLPRRDRHRIPYGVGDDIGFISNWDEACPPAASSRPGRLGHDGWLYVYRRRVVRQVGSMLGGYIAWLNASQRRLVYDPLSTDGSSWTQGSLPVRNGTIGSATRIGHVFSWTSLGRWL